ELLTTQDNLFRAVDCETGPDGAVYIADWCDKRISHVDPLDTWDRSNGRVYKIQSESSSTAFSSTAVGLRRSRENGLLSRALSSKGGEGEDRLNSTTVPFSSCSNLCLLS